MNDKTYADGIDADQVERGARALHEAEDSWNDYDWEYLPDTVKDSFRDQSRHVIRALTPDKTNTSEATAIGAGEVLSDGEIYSRASFDSLDHKRGFLEGLRFAASPKPDTNTSVDPGVEGVREAAKAMADAWDEDPDGEAVCEARNRVRAALATIDHPIARSGADAGDSTKA